MGAGIAGAHIRKGISVMLLDSVPQALEKGVGSISKVMQTRVEIGRMQPLEVVAALGRLSTTGTLTAMADRDVVIEAVIENEATKVQVYRELQPILKPDTIVASNTSTISISLRAASSRLACPRPYAGSSRSWIGTCS